MQHCWCICVWNPIQGVFVFADRRSSCGAVQLLPLADTALDVARAMVHLHKHNVVHSDLKARNVLLRSDMQDPRGFTAKVADFGLSMTIDPSATHISNAFQVRTLRGLDSLLQLSLLCVVLRVSTPGRKTF